MKCNMERIFTSLTASISELKKNPMSIIDQHEAVAILNRNKPVFYCVPADIYDAFLDMADDMRVAKIMEQRKHETPIKVTLDDI